MEGANISINRFGNVSKTEDAPTNPFDIFSVSELLEQFAYHSRVKRERRSGKKLVPRIQKAAKVGTNGNKDEQVRWTSYGGFLWVLAFLRNSCLVPDSTLRTRKLPQWILKPSWSARMCSHTKGNVLISSKVMTGRYSTCNILAGMHSFDMLWLWICSDCSRFFKSYFTDPTIAKEQERKRKATKKNLEDVGEEQVQRATRTANWKN